MIHRLAKKRAAEKSIARSAKQSFLIALSINQMPGRFHIQFLPTMNNPKPANTICQVPGSGTVTMDKAKLFRTAFPSPDKSATKNTQFPINAITHVDQLNRRAGAVEGVVEDHRLPPRNQRGHKNKQQPDK